MGVFASARHESPWAQDPEALLVFTLEVARDDPRLFDEVLDWLITNEALVSTRRLRAMCTVEGDKPLVDAVLAGLTHDSGARRKATPTPPDDPEPLFRGLGGPVAAHDENFARFGLLRPADEPSGKSRSPDLRAPINLAFRLRQITGLGVRPEAIRCLLTKDALPISTTDVTRAAGYARRNVQEALNALASAGVIQVLGKGRHERYELDRARWLHFLGEAPDWRVTYRAWPQLLGGLRRILRWLSRPDLEEASDYMRSSLARDLLEQLHEEFAYAGIPVDFGRTAAEAWAALERTIDRALAAVEPHDEFSPQLENHRPMAALEVHPTENGSHVWSLSSGNGQVIAISGQSFPSERAALDAARATSGQVPRLRFEVDADADGGYGWRALAPSGELVAIAPSAYSSKSGATRAAERVRASTWALRPPRR